MVSNKGADIMTCWDIWKVISDLCPQQDHGDGHAGISGKWDIWEIISGLCPQQDHGNGDAGISVKLAVICVHNKTMGMEMLGYLGSYQ